MRKTFPILSGGGASIDLQLVIDHGGQAKANHGQSVTRLAERGGLSWSELHAVLHNRQWQKMDANVAMLECRALEKKYLEAVEPRENVTTLKAEVERLTVALEKAESYVAGNQNIGQNERGFLLDEIVRPALAAALHSKGGSEKA